MRHAVMGFFILIMLIFAGASIYTAETKTMHQNELDSILGAAMEESMEILTVNPTYSIGKEVEGKELAADFIQNMLMRTTSKSTFEVEILTADAQKGLLDVRVTEYYRQIWGTGKAVARKTVILDDVEGKEEVFSKISFWKSYKDNKGEEKRIVKQAIWILKLFMRKPAVRQIKKEKYYKNIKKLLLFHHVSNIILIV